MPQFPGGENARIEYMINNVKYPAIAKEKGVEGTVYISFVIEKDGSISNTNVIRRILNVKGVGPAEKSLDAEAIRVVSAMPKWIPGSQGGKHVRVQFTMPIKFKLEG
jgi:periplasmic protein TonB